MYSATVCGICSGNSAPEEWRNCLFHVGVFGRLGVYVQLTLVQMRVWACRVGGIVFLVPIAGHVFCWLYSPFVYYQCPKPYTSQFQCVYVVHREELYIHAVRMEGVWVYWWFTVSFSGQKGRFCSPALWMARWYCGPRPTSPMTQYWSAHHSYVYSCLFLILWLPLFTTVCVCVPVCKGWGTRVLYDVGVQEEPVVVWSSQGGGCPQELR